MRDWKNVVGTGPFTLEEYIPGSTVILKRNPNYWGTDPLHPENQLPYVDEVKWLQIFDASTRLAAMRTGKVDWIQSLGWEEAASLRSTNPEIMESSFMQAAHESVVFMRVDTPPFDDKRVRRAMAMAIDQQALLNDFYGGDATILTVPVAPFPELIQMYTPLEEQSQEVQENYSYNPEKAKQLLAEAGYPNGFETEIVANTGQADLLAVLLSYWADIGVKVEAKVYEMSVFQSIRQSRSHKAMFLSIFASVAPRSMGTLVPHIYQNASMIDDPKINAAYDIVQANVVTNNVLADKTLHDLYPYVLDQCYFFDPPAPNLYTVWQPWIKGYGGEHTVGYTNWFNFPQFLWMDVDLKAEMKGK